MEKNSDVTIHETEIISILTISMVEIAEIITTLYNLKSESRNEL